MTKKIYEVTRTFKTDEFVNKEVEVKFDKISEEAFGKLMASNDWTMEQVATLGEFICEN